MSAQNSSPAGALGAFAGMIGLSAIVGLLATIMVTPAIAVTGMAASNTIGIFDSLPEYIRIDPLSQRNELYAQNTANPEDGYVKIAEVFSENREEVSYDQIAETVIQATLAAEDRRFYTHGGIDLQGIIRAATNNFVAGDITGGGSTLTQQLVKNIFINQAIQQFPPGEERNEAVRAAQETTLERKLNEAKLAIGLEKQYSKDEIMLAYLNIAGFGGNTYGIEAAAQQYFGITAAELNVAQAASLIAIVQQPTARSLLSEENYERNQNRRDVIIRAMHDEGFISTSERDEALNTPVDAEFVSLSTPRSGCIAADEYAKYMCDYIVNLIPELESLGATPEERNTAWRQGGYQLYTTLDMSLQRVAQDTVWNVVPADAVGETGNGIPYDIGGASVSVQSDTGRILTMAQNKRFDNSLEGGGVTTSAVNFNTDFPYGGSRGFQTGSTYKIFALVEWLEEGRGLQEFINGSPSRFEPASFTDSCNGPWSGAAWEPRNFAGAGGGVMSVLQATVNSVNTSYAAIAQQLDLCGIAETAERLGVMRADGGRLETNPSAVLGTNEISPLSMAAAFGAIQNGGQYCEPIAVDRLVDRNGTELPGQVSECRQAIDADVAAATTFAMREVITRGTGQASNPGGDVPVVGKTGTSDNARHTWMVGGSTRIGTASWVGNITGEFVVNNLPGGTNMRHEIFRPIMGAANAAYGGDAIPEVPERLLRGQGVNLPDVTGQDPEIARGIIEGLGFRLIVEEGQADSSLTQGLIATQNPAPGTFLSLGTPVRVQLSAGNQTTMPDVVSPGYTLDEARAVLIDAGFTNIVVRCEARRPNPGPDPDESPDPSPSPSPSVEPSPSPTPPPPAAADRVIEQSPSAGETVNRDATVRLTVQRDNCR